jgi:hypothetical protein
MFQAKLQMFQAKLQMFQAKLQISLLLLTIFSFCSFSSIANQSVLNEIIGKDKEIFKQSLEAIEQQNWQLAQSLLSGLHNQLPQNMLIQNNLAVVLFNQGKIEQSQQLLSSIIEQNKLTNIAYKNLKKLYSYSATITYSSGLNLYKPIELPDMYILDNKNLPKKLAKEKNKDLIRKKIKIVSGPKIMTPRSTSQSSNKDRLAFKKVLEQCNKYLDAYHLTQGISGNAYDCFKSVLQKDKRNIQALEGLIKVERKYHRLINKNIKLKKPSKAQYFLSILQKINPQYKATKGLKKQIDTLEQNKSIESERNFTFVKVLAGCFNKQFDKKEQTVCIKNNFLMGKNEVTQKQWQTVMGNNPSHFKDCGDSCPVENVSWFDVQDFIRKLNKKSTHKYRLPTENEWEYASRAGSKHTFSYGDKSEFLSIYANFCDNQCTKEWKDASQDDGFMETAPVSSYKGNDWGLHDMHGNVWEWVAKQGSNLYVYRGGSWGDHSLLCQSSSRGEGKPELQVSGLGFRLVKIP